MTPPEKPFDTYKWRWLSVTPSEGLLETPVFLGVLRALYRNEGEAYSSESLYNDLQVTKRETLTNINLARSRDRNLFRNSGQYWRGTGLLSPKSGEIELTPMGRQVALGNITQDEFTILMIRNTVLPNPQTYSDQEFGKWQKADLRIKPFELILSIMNTLGRENIEYAYLTPNELIKIVIPMAGAKRQENEISESILAYRQKNLDISSWPDCAPGANDPRLAREFLLFLSNFGVCRVDDNESRYDQKFVIEELFMDDFLSDEKASFLEDKSQIDEEIVASRDSQISSIIERRRVSTYVLQRSHQGRFRREVLEAYVNGCILTNEKTPDVIEAAHIRPVQYNGNDDVGNGFCMRVDIHRLFDKGKIRIYPDGSVHLHEQINGAISYKNLPRKVKFPPSVCIEHIQWRERYL